jgi:SAM-dependent methyltransferase
VAIRLSKEALLSHAPLYILVQRAVGADRMRALCIDVLAPRTGDRILDVGCGPAYYLERFPPVDYYGFDTDELYIAYARRRFGGRGRFYCETYSEKHLLELPRFDGVMLMGLLHHLDDRSAHALLDLVGRALAPSGKVITLDTCTDPALSAIARFLARQDRGEHVRPTSAFLELARDHFDHVEGRLVGDEWRAPFAHFLMTLAGPRARAA